MTKKSFKENNPAHHYIDISVPDTDITQNTENTYITDITYHTDNAHSTDTVHYTDNKHIMYSTEDTHKAHKTDYDYSMHNTDNTHKGERKTKRLNLLLQPEIFDKMSKIAVMNRTSVNNLINNVLKDYSAGKADVISKYNEIFH